MKLEHEEKTNEIMAMSYEIFLKRGFKFDRRRHRPSKREYLNLVDAENGIKHNFLPSHTKQLTEVKARLTLACNLIIRHQNLDTVNEQALINFCEEIQDAQNSKRVGELVEEALYFTQENK